MQPNCKSCFCFPFLLSPGTKHKTMLEARNGSGTIKAFPRAGVKGKGPVNKGNTGLQNKTFHCEICDVHVNSETQLKQVLSRLAEWESLAVLCFYGGKVPIQSACLRVCVQMELTDLSIVLGCHAVCFVLMMIFPCMEYAFSKALSCTSLLKSYRRCKLQQITTVFRLLELSWANKCCHFMYCMILALTKMWRWVQPVLSQNTE